MPCKHTRSPHGQSWSAGSGHPRGRPARRRGPTGPWGGTPNTCHFHSDPNLQLRFRTDDHRRHPGKSLLPVLGQLPGGPTPGTEARRAGTRHGEVLGTAVLSAGWGHAHRCHRLRPGSPPGQSLLSGVCSPEELTPAPTSPPSTQPILREQGAWGLGLGPADPGLAAWPLLVPPRGPSHESLGKAGPGHGEGPKDWGERAPPLLLRQAAPFLLAGSSPLCSRVHLKSRGNSPQTRFFA